MSVYVRFGSEVLRAARAEGIDRDHLPAFLDLEDGGELALLGQAGHIKPWKDSSAGERLDPRNGLAACPSHDVAFDTGMLTVTADLKIHLAQPLTPGSSISLVVPALPGLVVRLGRAGS